MKYESTAVFVGDIERSKLFYENVIGLRQMMDNGEHVAYLSGFSIWKRDSAVGLLGVKKSDSKVYNFELCFSSEDIHEDYKRVRESGAEIFSELAEQPWSQFVFRVYDPDRNIIEIGEELEETFLRLLHDGNTLEEVSRMTFTKPDDIKRILHGKHSF